MPKILIVVDGGVDAFGEPIASTPATAQMVAGLKIAIATSCKTGNAIANPPLSTESVIVQVVTTDTDLTKIWLQDLESEAVLLCPLTLDLPDAIHFPAKHLYQACRDVLGLRHQVEQQLQYLSGDGYFWLPVVLTEKGPLYAEAIGLTADKDVADKSSKYDQPLHLTDAQRQQVYQLGWQLLQWLAAPPATYLVQFGFEGQNIYFDRLWPFPAAPAIASVGIQSPDLFACHWHCLTGLPIFDLTIVSEQSWKS